LFGFDFLIDEDFRTWLIEINTNPYIGTPNLEMTKLIPNMMNEMFTIVLDPIFKP
jgi:D-alanine-D-alanine ligase-like ATP-grasp enzyme